MARTLLERLGTGTEESAYSTRLATDEIMCNADLVCDIIRLIGERNAHGSRDPSFLVRSWAAKTHLEIRTSCQNRTRWY